MSAVARRLAVSNIAWDAADDDAVATVLRAHGIDTVEVAPTKRWSDPSTASPADSTAWRDEWRQRGFRVASMQSLLFGRPDLVLFGNDEARERTLEYLDHVFVLAAAVGAGPLVFGSPANRRVGTLDVATARRVALDWFTRAGARAARHGVTLCIEPNPAQYGCDFLVTTDACVAFLEEADAPGLGLHLDAAAMHLNAEDPDRSIERAAPWLRHYHASEPFLAPVGRPVVRHEAHARALARIGYAGLIAIEMKAAPEKGATRHVEEAVVAVTDAYAALA